MNDPRSKIGSLLRFLASDGMAGIDPDIVKELLDGGRKLATLALNDSGASADTRAAARDFLDQLRADTYE